MKMKKTKRPLDLAVEEALAEAEKTRQAVADAELAYNKARAAHQESVAAVNRARLARDQELPQCLIERSSSAGLRLDPLKAVIVGRTEKEIKVRRLGDPDDKVLRFRASKYNKKKWNIYPAPLSCYGSSWINTEDIKEDGQ